MNRDRNRGNTACETPKPRTGVMTVMLDSTTVVPTPPVNGSWSERSGNGTYWLLQGNFRNKGRRFSTHAFGWYIYCDSDRRFPDKPGLPNEIVSIEKLCFF